MKNKINRRDFLKLLGLLPPYYLASRINKQTGNNFQSSQDNYLIIVFDAFSAYNISLYGYPRNTTPNLSLLSRKATVYHNHYAAGNFTSPGTASLLTGTHPWSHRAIKINSQVHDDFITKNIFHSFPDFHKIAYSHNTLVNHFFDQFEEDITEYIYRENLYLTNKSLLPTMFRNDQDISSVSMQRAVTREEETFSLSLFLSHLYQAYYQQSTKKLSKSFPRGLPGLELNPFLLEDGIDWVVENIPDLPKPFLGYFHFLPPHKPYNTRINFVDNFLEDGFEPISKPEHPLLKESSKAYGKKIRGNLPQWYDEYILYVDSEFNRLYKELEDNGILENTWIILTADHGEMFERGIFGHMTPLLHQPLVHIPLLIFEPGQNIRRDIYEKTSAVDILPTLLHLSGKPIPSWVEGEVLPPYGPPIKDRSIFALEAKKNQRFKPLSTAGAMIIKEKYKLTYYWGYRSYTGKHPQSELFNIDSDPEELNEISEDYPDITAALVDEVMEKINKADEPFK